VTDLERAKQIAATVVPGCNPDTSCMLIAAATAGLRGLSMRHIRAGALFWPGGFPDDPYLSMRGGWGCEGYDKGRVFLAEQIVDLDGGFSGHTWLEPEPGLVLDLMHDVDDTARYIRRVKLEQAIKAFWRPQMREAMKLGKQYLTFTP
jgi:hypothetical protein